MQRAQRERGAMRPRGGAMDVAIHTRIP